MTQHKMVMVNSRLLFKSDMLYLRGVTAPGFFFFYSFAYWKEEATMQSTFVTIENRIMAFGLICFNSAIDIMPKSIWTYGNWRLSFSSNLVFKIRNVLNVKTLFREDICKRVVDDLEPLSKTRISQPILISNDSAMLF